jgi:hypothetical protein
MPGRQAVEARVERLVEELVLESSSLGEASLSRRMEILMMKEKAEIDTEMGQHPPGRGVKRKRKQKTSQAIIVFDKPKVMEACDDDTSEDLGEVKPEERLSVNRLDGKTNDVSNF